MTALKKIEIKLSNLLIKLLKTSDIQVLIEQKEDLFNKDEFRKILLLRQDRIGDMLITTPLLQILKEEFPTKKFDILLGEKNIGAKNIVEPYVNSIYLFEKSVFKLLGLIKELKKQKYDLVIDLFDEPSTTSSIVIRLIKAKFSLGLKKEKSYAYSHLVPLLDRTKEHIVLRTAMLMLPFNIDPKEEYLKLEYRLDATEKETAEKSLGIKGALKRIGINLSGSNRGKFWGIENNIELIIALEKQDEDLEIVLFGTREYTIELNEIKNKTNVKIAPFVNSVHDYAAMLSTCDFLITPDTAAVHFASVFQIPTIPLYNLVKEGQNRIPWTPFNTPFEAVTTPSEKLSEIKPEKVVEAFNKLRFKIINYQNNH